MGVTFCAVAPEHPLALHAARGEPGARRLHRGVQDAAAPPRPSSRRRRRRACHRPDRRASAHPRADPGLGRQLRADGLRRRRRDGRAGARRARLRVRAEVRHRHPAGDPRRRRGTSPTTTGRTGTPTSSAASPSTPTTTAAWRTRPRSTRSPRALEHQGLGDEADHLAPARLGHQPPALLGHADPDHPLRRRCGVVPVPEKDLPVVLPEDLIPDGSRQPAEQARRRS